MTRLFSALSSVFLLSSLCVVLLASSEFPACEQEDSRGSCFWDAGSRGNGVGSSFWAE